MTTYQILCLLGVPGIFGAVLSIICGRLSKNIKDTKSVKLGIQALLRAQMINDYNKWMERGYAPIYAKENFDNMWEHYHSLGANGVMDDIHEKFIDLPTTKPR